MKTFSSNLLHIQKQNKSLFISMCNKVGWRVQQCLDSSIHCRLFPFNSISKKYGTPQTTSFHVESEFHLIFHGKIPHIITQSKGKRRNGRQELWIRSNLILYGIPFKSNLNIPYNIIFYPYLDVIKGGRRPLGHGKISHKIILCMRKNGVQSGRRKGRRVQSYVDFLFPYIWFSPNKIDETQSN